MHFYENIHKTCILRKVLQCIGKTRTFMIGVSLAFLVVEDRSLLTTKHVALRLSYKIKE